MASFAITDSGHVPIKKCLKATAAYAPPSPKRPRTATPALPVYYNEPKKAVDNFLLEESVLQEHKLMIQPALFSKKAKKASRENAPKQLKPKKINISKLQKHPIPNRIKLSKPKTEKKLLVKKTKNLSKKEIKSTPLPMHAMLPQDIVKEEDIPFSAFDQELQKSRISSYEDSINAVIKSIAPEKITYETSDFKTPSPLPPVAKSDSKGPGENFYLDIDVPLDSCQLSQLAAEREAHINDTIDGVIAQSSSLDDDLRMSPETGESDCELEPRQLQSAVVDRFDVSSVPSPQIPPTWQMLEEEVIEEVVVKFEKDEFKITQPEVSINTSTKQKSKKLKSRASEWPLSSIDTEPQIKTEEKDKKSCFRLSEWPPLLDVNAVTHVKVEEKPKKSKHRSSERLPFEFDPVASGDADEWDRRSKQPPAEPQFLDLSRGSSKVPDESEKKPKHRFVDRQPSNHEPLVVSRTTDDLEKKSKHRSVDRHLHDPLPYVGKTTDESDKRSKHRTVDRQPVDLNPFPYGIGGGELEKKAKHHRNVERQYHDLDPFVYIAPVDSEIKSRHRTVESLTADTIAPSRKDVGDRDKKSKHRSQDRGNFIPHPEPLKEVERQSASPGFLTNKVPLASAAEFHRSPLETVVNRLKRPASPALVPLPTAALPAVLAPSLLSDLDFVGQPPLKRIKIVSSASDINQFEIKVCGDLFCFCCLLFYDFTYFCWLSALRCK